MISKSRSRAGRLVLPALGVVGVLWAPAADAQPTWALPGDSFPGQCLLEQTQANLVTQTPNCTSNDSLDFAVRLRPQSPSPGNVEPPIADPCLFPGDTGEFYTQLQLRNDTAQTRYDVGLFVSLAGNTGDAFSGDACATSLVPVNGSVAGNPFCIDQAGGFLDIDGTLGQNVANTADGPYYSFEDPTFDVCGDLIASGQNPPCPDANGVQRDNLLDYTNTLALTCSDVLTDAGTLGADGYLDVSACASWGQQEDEVGTNIDAPNDGACENVGEVHPGTPAKCQCLEQSAFIPAANLACQNPENPLSDQILCVDQDGNELDELSQLGAGAVVTCSVRLTNANANILDGTTACTTTSPEEHRCGYAAFLYWDVSVLVGGTDPIQPSVVATTPVSGDPEGNDLFALVAPSTNLLRFTPLSDVGTDGVVQPNTSPTLEFTFEMPLQEDESVRTVEVLAQAYWADNQTDAASGVGVAQNLSCSSTFTATPVTLAYTRVRGLGDSRRVEWTTATEAGNIGFNVLAETEAGLQRVNDELIPSKGVDSTRPLDYSFDVSSVEAGRFWIEEVDAAGRSQRHGPFRLGQTYGRAPAVEAIDWRPIRELNARRADRRPLRVASEARSSGRFDPVELHVRRDAVYRVTYEQLTAAGFDFGGAQASALALTHRGRAVPVRVLGAGKSFGPGSAIEFFAEGIDSLYTEDNVYVLSADRKSSLSIGEELAIPSEGSQPFVIATVVRDNDVSYSFTSPTDDPWFESRLLARGGRAATQTYEFTVDDLVAGASAASLSVDVWGQSQWPADPDHHVTVFVNGAQVADARWDDIVGEIIEATIPDGVLQDGVNTLTISVPGDNDSPWDLVNFDSFEVRYPSAVVARDGELLFTAEGGAYSVSGVSGEDLAVYRIDGERTVLLSGLEVSQGQVTFATVPGSRYAVVSGGRETVSSLAAARLPDDLTKGRADYLIVSHASFIGGLTPLVDFHQSRGLAVKVVDVADVYATYSGGIVDPQAIRDYVRIAAFEMGTEYLLLVGADSYDYKDNLGLGSVSFIPTPYLRTDWLITYSPVDPLYGDVDGDLIPDLSVGRFPVRSLEELDTVIGKTLEYDAKLYGRTALVAADGFDAAGGVSFTGDANRFRGLLSGFETESAYVDQLGVVGARGRLTEAIGRGAALTVFFGHSGPTAWGTNGFFTTADAASLTNYGKPTVVVQWGCWNTYHVEPAFNTLGHTFLVGGNQGAAAVLGSATLMSTGSEELLSSYLARRLVEPGLSIGHAVTLAKQELAARDAGKLDAILGWTILGDPALVVEP